MLTSSVVADVAARRSRMRQRPAEIDLRFGELAVLHRKDFGVAETIAAGPTSFIGDEDLIAGAEQVNEIELLDIISGRPAMIHVARPAEPVVVRAGEVKIVGEQRFDRCTIPFDVGLVDAAGDGNIVLML